MTEKPIANMFELPVKHHLKGRFEAYTTRVGGAVGAEALGVQYIVVPPGKTGYPRHNHRNNEELFVVLQGEGTYRRGDTSWPVKAGDAIAAPAGDARTAHQLANTGHEDLKYLAISTRNDPDIIEYPDSNKYMIAASIPPGGGMMGADFKIVGRERPLLDYWDGEDTGEDLI
ncbi:MAG: cupin domain-containing protein [Alphaproteobacteria bacterium]|nr:cupin domain-containing protein [Alphaproteobacteria bacterium]